MRLLGDEIARKRGPSASGPNQAQLAATWVALPGTPKFTFSGL
jgi:hypothetical protein